MSDLNQPGGMQAANPMGLPPLPDIEENQLPQDPDDETVEKELPVEQQQQGSGSDSSEEAEERHQSQADEQSDAVPEKNDEDFGGDIYRTDKKA